MNPQHTPLESYKELLTEFHRTFLQPVVISYADCRFDKLPLRSNLIAEEFAEYVKAPTRVDMIDALGDLMYVTIGTVITTGVSPWEYTSGGFDKKIPPHKTPLFNQVAAMLGVLKKEKPCYRGLKTATTELYWGINRAAEVLHFNLLTAVYMIHQSNMTKRWTEENLATEFDPKTMEKHPIADTKLYVVMRASDKKVLKPSTYQKVDLSSL